MKVAILTNFNEFNPGYSLTGIVADQARMFNRHGHDVTIFVAEDAHYNPRHDHQWPDLELCKAVPRGEMVDYMSSQDMNDKAKELASRVTCFLTNTVSEYDVAITHDWIFTGWNLPYAMGLMMCLEETASTSFLHMIHSVPSGHRDWWLMNAYSKNHKIVTPSQSCSEEAMRSYWTNKTCVRTIPHIKDLRTWYNFSDETNAFIDEYPAVMQSKVVCVYPASSDRLGAKQVHRVIDLVAGIKKRNKSACLVIPNQWSQGKRQREAMPMMTELAEERGLVPGQDFIWTSEFQAPKYEMGIPRHMVRELLLCANLFVFPSVGESFGLVQAEAALSGCYIVLNEDLDVSKEIFGHKGKYFHFGSAKRNFEPGCGWEQWMDEIAGATLGSMMIDDTITLQTIIRRNLNMDAVYFDHYEPLIMEMRAQ